MTQNIRKLSDRDHVMLRPAMYIGAVTPTKTNDYLFEEDKILYKEIEYVPGLIKIINEIIDNSVDVAIKTNFEFSNEISVSMENLTVTVQDNGTGIPVKKNEDGHYLPELCWNNPRAGSNFDDDDNRTQIGMNGIGSYATACFSKEFIGQTDDGMNSFTIVISNNAASFTEKLGKSKKRGTVVTFTPDFERFGVSGLDDTHKNVIRQRLINLSLSFPKIQFKFNGKRINAGSFKKYVSLFNPQFEIYENESYSFAILPNDEDDFKQFSYVNGLKIPDGGTHIETIVNSITYRIREKLLKKYKTIKPGDIRNKLMVVAFLKDLKNPKFNSQAKEKITNSVAEINSYFGNIDYDVISRRIMKNDAIMDPIVEVYRIKEEFKRREELKKLDKTVKKIKSDKYLPPIANKKYLLLVEGDSAAGGLMPVLGRKDCGYYILRGKPLNAYSAETSKFTSNKELSELYKIIQNEGYERIVFATDQDLDGFHIRGLLIGFFSRYLEEYKEKLAFLQTPVLGVKKNKKLVRWYYSLNDEVQPSKGEEVKYYKGLGSWREDDLKEIVSIDGLSNMVSNLVFDNESLIDDWLSDTKADRRKEHILNNEFSIAKV